MARCGHDYHKYCLLMFLYGDMEEKCTICNGIMGLEQGLENLVKEFNEGKLDLTALNDYELDNICKSVFEAKRKDFKEVLQRIFKVKDLKIFCLYEAALLGHLDAVEWILSQTGEFDRAKLLENSRKSGNAEMLRYNLDFELYLMENFIFVEPGCFKRISDFFEKSSNHFDNHFKNVFLLTCSTGNVEMLQKLLEKGAKIDSEDGEGRTVLHYAARNTFNPEVVDFLVSLGAKVSEKSFPILSQVYYSNDRSYEVVEKLIQVGAKISWGNDSQYDVPVFLACLNRNYKCLRLFLANGVDIEERFRANNLTILFLSICFKSDLNFLKELIVDFGADFKAVDGRGMGALHFVCSLLGSVEALDYFLSLGLDVNSVDREGNSVLHHVFKGLNGLSGNSWGDYPDAVVDISRKQALELVARLVEHGANVNLVNNDGYHPIHLLACHDEIFEFLIKHGADVNAKDNKGCSVAYMLGRYSTEDHEDFFRHAIKLSLDCETTDNAI